MVVLINANDEQQVFSADAFKGKKMMLHFVQRTSVDPVVKTAKFNATNRRLHHPGPHNCRIRRIRTPQGKADQPDRRCASFGNARALNKGQANSLVTKLQTAIKRMDSKQPAQAAAQLGSFINQVRDLMNTGVLTPDQAWPLIDTATDIRQQIVAKMY
jgi:hypothetical protein